MLTRRPRTTNVVGVTIDGDVLRGVQMRRWFGSTRAVKCAEVELERDPTDAGRVVDPDLVADGLRQLWKAGRFRTSRLALGIDGRDATRRRISVPIAAADDLATAVRYELADYLPYDLDDAVTDFNELDRDDEHIHVVAVAIKRSTAESAAAIAADAGLRLTTLHIASSEVSVVVDHDTDFERDAIVSLDGATTSIVLRHRGHITVTRVLSSGGGERRADVADEIEQALAIVDLFRRVGNAHPTEESDGRRRRFRAAVEEVNAAIHFEETETGERVAAVFVGGAYGAEPEPRALMAEGLEAEVSVAPTPHWWRADAPFPAFMAPAGTAARAIGFGQTRTFDLEAPSLVQRRSRRRELVLGVAVGLLMAGPAFRVVDSTRAAAETATDHAVATEHEADLVAASVDRLDDLAQLSDEVENAQRLVDDAVAGELWWPKLLEDVAGITPDDVFLTGVSLRQPQPEEIDAETSASFSGIALDQAGAGRWLLAIAEIDGIDDVWLVQSTATFFGETEIPVVSFIAEADLTDSLLSPRASADSSSASAA